MSGCLCDSAIEELRKEILIEAHNSPFSIHPGGTKMYQDLKQVLSVEKHEERCGWVCEQVLSVSTSKNSPTKDGKDVTTPKYTKVEVGKYSYGLDSRTTQNAEGLYNNLGNCQQVD